MSSKKWPKVTPFLDKTKNMDLSQNTLLSTLLNDPASRAMVLQFVTQAEKDIKYKEDQAKKVENKLKKTRIVCDSPTAQFRKKELARLDSANSLASSESESSSTCSTNDTTEFVERVPFNVLLRGLTIYVEVFSNGQDKSLSAMALVESMGAKVNDRIARGVTHVIFKDGSYHTYQLAKRLKMHVVSILWLQAVKRKGTLVPEKDYPAFGIDQGELNVSTICKSLQSEFDDVCQDERFKINSLNTVDKTATTTSKSNVIPKNTPSTSIRKSVIDSDDEDSVFLSANSSKTASSVSVQSSTKLSSEILLNSPIIDHGETYKSLLNDSLELTTNIVENTNTTVMANKRNRRKTLYNPEDNSMLEINMSRNKRKTMFAIPVLKESNRDLNISNVSLNKDNTMDLTTCLEKSNNFTVRNSTTSTVENSSSINNTTNRRSKVSFESNNSTNSSNRSSTNSMDLTSFAGPRRRSVRIASKSEDIFKKPDEPIKGTESKESSFSEKLSSLRISPESNKRQSTDNSNANLSFDKNIIQSENLTSSLRLSEDPNSNNKSISNDLMGELSQLRIDTNNSAQEPIEMSCFKPSESGSNANQDIHKKRFSDESQNDLTPSKKYRQENTQQKQKKLSVSEQISSDDPGKKKYRKLYDVDNPVNNEDLILQIETVYSTKPKENHPKGRVKQAMELIAKPFDLTPETDRGKPKPISSDSEEESANNSKKNKTVAKKHFTKIRNTKLNNNKKAATIEDLPETKSVDTSKSAPPTQVFANPKTPKKVRDKPPVTPSRKSSRFATPVNYKRFYNHDKTSSLDESVESNASVITPKLNRRSTMDFTTSMNITPRSLTQKADSVNKKGPLRAGIACTRFKVGRVNTFKHIVRRLGRFHIDDNVIARTTHLVVGENKRTVNILRAIARGCWILSADWLYKSMAAGKWLPEDDYEFTDFSEAVQFCRKEREAFGSTYTADTFLSSGPIYVARRGTKPIGDELRELVRLAGGTIAPVARSASIVVGEVVRYDTVHWCVSELWVLDSITHNQMAELAEYNLIVAGEDGVVGRQERRLSEDY